MYNMLNIAREIIATALRLDLQTKNIPLFAYLRVNHQNTNMKKVMKNIPP